MFINSTLMETSPTKKKDTQNIVLNVLVTVKFLWARTLSFEMSKNNLLFWLPAQARQKLRIWALALKNIIILKRSMKKILYQNTTNFPQLRFLKLMNLTRLTVGSLCTKLCTTKIMKTKNTRKHITTQKRRELFKLSVNRFQMSSSTLLA